MPIKYINSPGISTVVIAVLSLSAAAGFAMNRAPQGTGTDTKTVAPDDSQQAAQDLLAKMAAKYKGLTAFSCDETLTEKSPQKTIEIASKVTFKSGKAAVTVTSPEGRFNRVFDGKTLFVTTSLDPSKYAKQPMQTPAAGIRAAFSQADIGLLPILLMDPDAKDKVLLPNSDPPVLQAGGSSVDGVAVDVVSANLANGQGKFRFEIGKEDSLLRRITILQEKDGVEIRSVSAAYRNIQINPILDESQFVFKPAPGQVVQEAPTEPTSFDARLKKGANPLPFAGTDTAGKPVNLAQYKGKVVLIDFWATWCGPCVAELPNVITAYNKYKPRGFDVVGVSLDEASDKPKLVKFTTNNKMPWRQVFDGKGWNSKLATGYGIKAIPFTLLIGKDGKIAAVNPRGPELEPAVKAALAAK